MGPLPGQKTIRLAKKEGGFSFRRNDWKGNFQVSYETIKFGNLASNHQNDGFDCRGVRPDAHYRASATRPYMPGAQKLRSAAHFQGALQRRSWSATPQMDFLRNHQYSKNEMPNSRSVKKITVFLSSIIFLLAILTLTFHYERYSYRLAGCSIWNIKNSTSLSVQKIMSDPLSAMAANHPWPEEILPASPEILSADAPVHIPSLLSCTFFNKAPPIFS